MEPLGDERTEKMKRFGRIFKKVVPVILLLFVCVGFGGITNRIRGGFLSVQSPNTTDTPSTSSVFLHDSTLRAIYAVPFGIFGGGLLRERNNLDPYHFRRYGFGFFLSLTTYLDLYTGWGSYFTVGNQVQDRSGVFDWLIGQNCPGWNLTRRFTTQFVGMSLRGLLQTAPAGYLLYSLGYGPDFGLSGIAMGSIYWLAFQIPTTATNFSQGTPLAELLWGSFQWFCLAIPILCWRRQPEDNITNLLRSSSSSSSGKKKRGWNKKKVLFWSLLVLLDSILIGSCVGYGFVEQDDMVNRDQTLLGIICATLFTLGVQIIAILYAIRKNHKFNSEMSLDHIIEEEYIPMATMENNGIRYTLAYDPTEDALRKEVMNWLVPEDAKSPFKYLLTLVRLVVWVLFLLVLGFFFYSIIANRAMTPCPVVFKYANATDFSLSSPTPPSTLSFP